jgi:hypothetical protein
MVCPILRVNEERIIKKVMNMKMRGKPQKRKAKVKIGTVG